VHESWCDNELRLSILVRNENELLWSSADNVILVVYPIKFIFSCLSYSSWIGWGTNRFGSFQVRVYIGSIRVRVSSDSIRVISNFGSIRIITVSSWFGLGSVQFRIEIGSTLSHVGSGLISVCSVWVVWFGSLLPGLSNSFAHY